MSWIVSLYQIPSQIETLADMPDDFALPPLGTTGEVTAILSEFLPQTDFAAPDWVEVRSEELGGIFVSEGDPIFDVMLRDPSPDFVERICARTGWRAFDPENGRLIRPQ